MSAIQRIKLIMILGVVVLLVIVILQNTEEVRTNLLFFSPVMPRALLLFITTGLGFVVGYLVSARGRRNRR